MSNTRQAIGELTNTVIPPLRNKPISKVSNSKSMVEWRHIDWHKLEKRVYKLQKRIYKASSRGDRPSARRLTILSTRFEAIAQSAVPEAIALPSGE